MRNKKLLASGKIVDYILLFELDCRERAYKVADNLKLKGLERRDFIRKIKKNLPPMHREFWLIDELMEKNGLIHRTDSTTTSS